MVNWHSQPRTDILNYPIEGTIFILLQSIVSFSNDHGTFYTLCHFHKGMAHYDQFSLYAWALTYLPYEEDLLFLFAGSYV